MAKEKIGNQMIREIEHLNQRRQKALQMGGPERVDRQHKRGKLTARERVALLMDDNTFQEYGLLANHQSHRAEMANKDAPADGVITGFGQINGLRAGVIAEDFTVMGGSIGMTHGMKKFRMVQLSTQERAPLIWLMDGAGARAEEFIAEGLPMVAHHLFTAKMSGIAPSVGVVMGPCAGDSSLAACLLEFIIMTKKEGMLAAGGPPVVLAATGEVVSKEDLGGWKVHCVESGVADNPAEDDADAIAMTKRYLSYLPSSAYEYPPYMDTGDAPDRMDEDLLNIIPDNLLIPYDMKCIINSIVDRGTFFEIKPEYAKMMITGFARMNGHVMGIIANQPKVFSGAITAKAAQKERHFIDLCTAYHIPLLFLVDVPGIMTGQVAEKEGVLRYGLELAYSLSWSDVPKITVVIHKAFGMGGAVMCGYGAGQTLTLAWPRVNFGSIPAGGGVLAAHQAELAAAADPKALARELEEAYNKYQGPYQAASTFNVDDVIDPRETRPRIIRALELSLGRRTAPASPGMRWGVMP
ncbi:MAG: carboxyl transferase domain-containing protein [Dehalococcoidia bacterium]